MASSYALELDDAHVGWLAAPDGRLDIDPWLRRREATFGLHPGRHRGLWDWIEGSPHGERRDGAIVGFDAEGRELERLEFAGATVAELGLPGLRPDHAGAGALTLRVQVRAAELRAGGDAVAHDRGEALAIAACRLHLAGPTAGTHPVLAVEALLLRTGPGRHPHAALQRLALRVAAGAPWDEALVGHDAALEYLAADASTVLARLDFRVAGVRGEPTPGGMRVELGCRHMQLTPAPA